MVPQAKDGQQGGKVQAGTPHSHSIEPETQPRSSHKWRRSMWLQQVHRRVSHAGSKASQGRDPWPHQATSLYFSCLSLQKGASSFSLPQLRTGIGDVLKENSEKPTKKMVVQSTQQELPLDSEPPNLLSQVRCPWKLGSQHKIQVHYTRSWFSEDLSHLQS